MIWVGAADRGTCRRLVWNEIAGVLCFLCLRDGGGGSGGCGGGDGGGSDE